VLSFLGLPYHAPSGFDVVNASKRHRSRGLAMLLVGLPVSLRRTLRGLVPERIRRGIRRMLVRLNTERGRRAPLDPDLRRALQQELQPEVERLGRLLGRDLSAWSHD
ncbi:MAG: hypothetical protein ACREKM_02020, partial [Longimicrobiales bacterium]